MSLRLLVRVALLAALAAPAGAEIYRWVDAQGREHFTTRLEDVPPRQRDGAAAEAQGRRRLNRSSAPAAGAAAHSAPASRRKTWQLEEERPKGRPEAWWRTEHAKRADRVTSLEAQIAEFERLGVTQPPAPRRVSNASSRNWNRYMARWRARQRADRDLERARKELARFRENARRSGVPPGWLR